MNKKEKFQIILLALVVSLTANIFLSRYLTAQISTWPLLNRLKILSPQSPIVINKREEIRISDSGDILAAAQEVEPKVSGLAFVDKGRVVFAGSVLNLTSDGLFVGAASVLPKVEPAVYFIVSSEGKTAPVIGVVKDPVSGVVFLKTNLNGVSVAALGNSALLKPGEKVAVVWTNSAALSLVDSRLVRAAQNNSSGQNFSADFVQRSFEVNSPETLVAGQILANLKGEAVGIFNSSRGIISSDVLRHSFAIFLKNNGKVVYPKFGFEYKIVSKAESSLLNLPSGLLVSAVAPGSSAAMAGLRPGDVVLQAESDVFAKTDILPEEILQKYTAGQKVTFKISRGKENIILVLTLGEQK